jgi:hypothetical protein
MQPSPRQTADQAPGLSLLELAKLGHDLRAAYDEVLREAAPENQRQLLRASADRLNEPPVTSVSPQRSPASNPVEASFASADPNADTFVFNLAPLGVDPAERACLLEALRVAREKLSACASKMPASSIARAGAETLMTNIDDLALLLTGDRAFFQ